MCVCMYVCVCCVSLSNQLEVECVEAHMQDNKQQSISQIEYNMYDKQGPFFAR